MNLSDKNSINPNYNSAFPNYFSFSTLLVEEEWYGFTFSSQQNVWIACHRVGDVTNLYKLNFSDGLPETILPGNFFGYSGSSYQLSAPIWSPDGQYIAFAVNSSQDTESGLWIVDYMDGSLDQIFQGSINFATGSFNEFTQTHLNRNTPDLLFTDDGKSLIFRSIYKDTSEMNDCLAEPICYSVLLQVSIDKSTIKTRCRVKNGRVQSFTALDISAETVAVGINWGQYSEVYIINEAPLYINSPSNTPLDTDGIYAGICVTWDKHDSDLPLLVRCNNTGFAKWHRFALKVGQLVYSSTQTICSGNFDDGQLLVQPDGWLLTTSEVGLGRETIWLCDRTGNKNAITEAQNAVETIAARIGSEVYFYEEKAFQPPILLKIGTHQSRTEVAICSHRRGKVQLELTDFSTKDGQHPYVQIYLPDTEPPVGGFPGIVWIKGGPITNLSRYSSFISVELLVKQGFAVASVNYRASNGQGVVHMSAGLAENLGIADRDDVLRTAEIFANHPHINASRLGVWGYSWGGYLVLQTITAPQHPFVCACGSGFISNWHTQQTQTEVRYYDHRLVGDYVNELAERVKERSPIHRFSPEIVKIPVLLFQGEHDVDTPVNQAYELQRVIKDHAWKKPVTLKIMSSEGHSFSQVAELQYWRESVRFFTRYLKHWNLIDNPSGSQSLY
ncbi:prolyl oligopeptidase family serine peptidase [Oscillatoria sp. HE19RPO]|uniref:S9 family peptidase n=1 Tax=Oscillatoria sp. HE19RPO TaxID=2954806 RepID=UPI0020C37B45|nr:prolyl oligopeptidase family serine peptidase [Oscillatoria sp. HE19RPO]